MENDASYEKLAQDASLLMKVNKKFAHTGQPKPSKMDSKLYKSGENGCASCNIFWNCKNLFEGVSGWIDDHGVFDSVGHRRWCLNPPMKKTGFGKVGEYYAMYAFNTDNTEKIYKNVVWPCRNQPLEFGNSPIWTLSMDKIPEDITVTLTNYDTGKVEQYSKNKSNSKTFNIIKSDYTCIGAVAINRKRVDKEESYRVDVKGKGISISYDVNFFSVKCNHKLELIDSIEPSCIKPGKKYFYCKICDKKEEKEIPMIPHKEKLIKEVCATCTQNGKQLLECEYCFGQQEKILNTSPHNYRTTCLSKSTGESQGECIDCDKVIYFDAPTYYTVFWGSSDTGNNTFTNKLPNNIRKGLTLYCWVSNINGDQEYREMIIEPSDNNLIRIEDDNQVIKPLQLIGVGNAQITIYPKYNPELR